MERSGATLAAALTDTTRAVIPVHSTGLPLPMDEIRAAVGPDGIIIEDAAHAIGAHTGDEIVGSCRHSDMAIFSFHPVKGITSGEGGMVTTRNERLRDRLACSAPTASRPSRPPTRAAGSRSRPLGFNYRLTDIQAALAPHNCASGRLHHPPQPDRGPLPRRALARPTRTPAAAPAGARHAYHLFVIHHRDGAPARRALFDALHERGVLVQVHYVPVYRHP